MRVRARARRHVPALTLVLSAVSLALVFGAALRAIPPAVLPRAPESVVAAIPHVNAVIVSVAFATVALGWYWIRAGAIRRHRAAMLAAFALFATFLALYLYRVALVGPTSYEGGVAPAMLYYAVLGVHVTLAIVCVPLVYYVLLLGLTTPVAALAETRHARVGRVAATLWLASFALGLVVYAMLYG